MKQILLLPVIAILSISATYAPQEPTKEETKYWLNNYGKKLLVRNPESTYQEYLTDKVDFYINDQSIYKYNYLNRNGEKEKWNWSIQLESINSITLHSTSIEIISNKQVYFVWIGLERKEYYDSMTLAFDDEETTLRFYKALKHYFSFFDYNIEYVNRQDIKNKF